MRPLLTNAAARRLFLHRHALAEPPTGPAYGAALADLIARIGFVQVDSINTVERAHHMILWSRRQSYRPAALKQLLEQDRLLWEHWTHDASILPIGLYPHWKHRFTRSEARLRERWKTWFRSGFEDQFDTILRRIEAEGPVTTTDVGAGEPRGKGGWWDWHPSKTALEWLWRTGALAITRRDGFQKVYDLSHRVIPAPHHAADHDAAAHVDWACRSALEKVGFADASELRGYWGAITPEETKSWVKAALSQGEITEIGVQGADTSPRRAYANPDVLAEAAAAPEPPNRLRILSPFDPALRDRDRAQHLFGFHYRIEVFTPEPRRKYGYYVFPVLEGAQIIGRIDAKAFRDQSTLRVKGFWPEPGVKMGAGRQQRLEAEVQRLAIFSGCDQVAFLDGWLREPLSA